MEWGELGREWGERREWGKMEGRRGGREGEICAYIVALYDAIICLSIRNYVHNNQGCVRSSLAFN